MRRIATLIALLWPFAASAQYGTSGAEWRHYAGDGGGTHYAPLDQIRPETLGDLEVAWRWSAPENAFDIWQLAFEATPLMVDGVLYTSTSFGYAAAIDAATGETIWTYDSFARGSNRVANPRKSSRGVGYWEQHGDPWFPGRERRVFLATFDARLIALDVETGQPIPSFGANGSVDLLSGIPRLDPSSTFYGVTSAPTVCGDVVVVGSSIQDPTLSKEGPPGDVRGFDVRTGELRWTFHTVPREGEHGTSTWGDDPISGVPSWQYSGGANVWAPMSCDAEAGIVYLPVSCPTNNFYGGHRPGDNLFANSIVALDATTGERMWHFQTIHHDIWDYDLAAAPNLMDIVVDGTAIQAVAQITKQGFVYVFDRITGEPVWPIEEVPVPQSSEANEATSPTQPFPTKPPPFERQGVSLDELNDATPEILAEAQDLTADFVAGPLFTPPSPQGTLLTPGIAGDWAGGTFDPETQILYVPSRTWPWVAYLLPAGEGNLDVASTALPVAGPGGQSLLRSPTSTITAYDMNEGEILWQIANDSGAATPGTPLSLLTRRLLFHASRDDPALQAFDKTNGALLWSRTLAARPTGAPMTYEHRGRQYLVIAIGAQREHMELVAFALPSTALEIDIEPDSDANVVHPMWFGHTAVAIFGSEQLDVGVIDGSTLRFGRMETPLAHRSGPQFDDVNGDGRMDLLAHFRTRMTGIVRGDTEACVAGETWDQRPIQGCDVIMSDARCGLGWELAFLAAPLALAGARLRRGRAR